MACHNFAYTLSYPMEVGQRIVERLEVTGLSQSELARRVGLSQPAINSLIRGNSRSSTHLHRIARELGTTPAYLAGETDDPDADAPPAPELTPDEEKLLINWRQLSLDDRKALDRIVDTMVAPNTVHSPRVSYRRGG